ncbi:MAG TPA: hypothetical protein PLR99_30585 [Polyangiaceae bacterium]|nr:hypothetical protein [Polyangiaceae bacterium]
MASEHESELGPEAPPTEDELRDARALMEALERGDGGGPAELLHAVKLASAPSAIETEDHERLVAKALAAADARGARARGGRVIRVAFGAVTAFAVAAAVVLSITPSRGPRATAPLARSRSTQELFREPFRASEASARIDRIAVARVGDLRENRFALWGVQ